MCTLPPWFCNSTLPQHTLQIFPDQYWTRHIIKQGLLQKQRGLYPSQPIFVTWHHKMSRKLHLLVLRYRHFYTAEKIVNKKTLTGIIKFISILKNGNSGMFGIILKLVLQGRGLHQNYLFMEMQLSTHFVVPGHICDPTPANEALCGKINFELWAKMWSKVKISLIFKYA